MILFVSAYPQGDTQSEELTRRIFAIDATFAQYERAYLSIGHGRHLVPEWEEVAPGVTVHRVNLYIHFWYILYLASKASMLYVHSFSNALRILPLYLSFPIVTDLRGDIPEALTEGAETLGKSLHSLAEWLVVRKSRALVAQTAALAANWRQKCGDATPRIFTLPDDAAARDAGALAAFVAQKEA